MFKKIAAIVFIYFCASIAWIILGTTVEVRTRKPDSQLRDRVADLWGGPLYQQAPELKFLEKSRSDAAGLAPDPAAGAVQAPSPKEPAKPTYRPGSVDATDIVAAVELDHRKKGLLWYATYKVTFAATYEIANHTGEEQDGVFTFPLPARNARYDNFRFEVDGVELQDIPVTDGEVVHTLKMTAGQRRTMRVAYRTQGLSVWSYSFGSSVSQVKKFRLALTTDFKDIDFPDASVSPTRKEPTPDGWKLTWDYESMLSGVMIGMTMPDKLNPGPWVSKVTFFAPVSLFIFFFLLFMITTLRNIRVHPMHYFFIAASFFAYHVLLAYLVDHISIHWAFWVCSAVSILLTVSYMRLVVGNRFAFLEVALSQFVFLVVFSYTFFFEGFTGLAITLMSIATLFVVMQLTARVDWEKFFGGGRNGAAGAAMR